MNFYLALAGMAAWFLFGHWAGVRAERRRCLAIVEDHPENPKAAAAKILRGERPTT